MEFIACNNNSHHHIPVTTVTEHWPPCIVADYHHTETNQSPPSLSANPSHPQPKWRQSREQAPVPAVVPSYLPRRSPHSAPCRALTWTRSTPTTREPHPQPTGLGPNNTAARSKSEEASARRRPVSHTGGEVQTRAGIPCLSDFTSPTSDESVNR